MSYDASLARPRALRRVGVQPPSSPEDFFYRVDARAAAMLPAVAAPTTPDTTTSAAPESSVDAVLMALLAPGASRTPDECPASPPPPAAPPAALGAAQWLAAARRLVEWVLARVIAASAGPAHTAESESPDESAARAEAMWTRLLRAAAGQGASQRGGAVEDSADESPRDAVARVALSVLRPPRLRGDIGDMGNSDAGRVGGTMSGELRATGDDYEEPTAEGAEVTEHVPRFVAEQTGRLCAALGERTTLRERVKQVHPFATPRAREPACLVLSPTALSPSPPISFGTPCPSSSLASARSAHASPIPRKGAPTS